jgi:hypothetical protein
MYAMAVTVAVVAVLTVWLWPHAPYAFLTFWLVVLTRPFLVRAELLRPWDWSMDSQPWHWGWLVPVLVITLFAACLAIRSQLSDALVVGVFALAAGTRFLGAKLQGRARTAGIIASYSLLNLSVILLAVLVLRR